MEMRESDPAAHQAFLDFQELAAARASLVGPVRLICDAEELCRGVANPARVERLKEISPELARKKSAAHTVLHPRHKNVRTTDVTAKSPGESVNTILHEIELIMSSF